MITIYFDYRKLFIGSKINEFPGNLHHYESKSKLHSFISDFHHDISVSSAYIICDDVKKVLKKVKAYFKVVKAAGGIVVSPSGKMLFIFRNGKWDLPKGKFQNFESKKQCAKREVMEECGLPELTIVKKIMTSYHTYHQKGRHIIKPTSWYLMSVDEEFSLVPQSNENISKAEWFNLDKIKNEILINSFPLINEVFAEFIKVAKNQNIKII